MTSRSRRSFSAPGWGIFFNSKVYYYSYRDPTNLAKKVGASLPTQEERLSTLEQTTNMHGKGIDDLNHNVTILLGITSQQGKDIRALKVSVDALSERLGAFEQRVDSRFVALDGHIGALDGRVSGLDGRIGALEQNVNNRFELLDGRIGALEQSVNNRFEEQGKKLDQVLLLLNSVIPKPEQ